MVLEQEMETYNQELPKLLDEEGKFALVYKDKLIDTFGTYEDALKEGYRVAGLNPFLVKQIHQLEQVQYISWTLSIRYGHKGLALLQ